MVRASPMHVLDSRKRKSCYTGSQTPFRARDAGPVLGTDNPSLNSWADRPVPFGDMWIYEIRGDWPEATLVQFDPGVCGWYSGHIGCKHCKISRVRRAQVGAERAGSCPARSA